MRQPLVKGELRESVSGRQVEPMVDAAPATGLHGVGLVDRSCASGAKPPTFTPQKSK